MPQSNPDSIESGLLLLNPCSGFDFFNFIKLALNHSKTINISRFLNVLDTSDLNVASPYMDFCHEASRTLSSTKKLTSISLKFLLTQIQILKLIRFSEMLVVEVLHKVDALAGGFHLGAELFLYFRELIEREYRLFDSPVFQF